MDLTLSRRRSLSYRNQSTDLPSKSMDWFLYDNGLRQKRLKMKLRNEDLLLVPVSFTKILFTVPEKCPNREFFLFCIWTLFTQCKYRFSVNLRKTPLRTDNKSILSVKANNSAINPTKPINSQNHQLKFLTHFCKLPF